MKSPAEVRLQLLAHSFPQGEISGRNMRGSAHPVINRARWDSVTHRREENYHILVSSSFKRFSDCQLTLRSDRFGFQSSHELKKNNKKNKKKQHTTNTNTTNTNNILLYRTVHPINAVLALTPSQLNPNRTVGPKNTGCSRRNGISQHTNQNQA